MHQPPSFSTVHHPLATVTLLAIMDSMPSSHDNGLPDYNMVRALQVLKYAKTLIHRNTNLLTWVKLM